MRLGGWQRLYVLVLAIWALVLIVEAYREWWNSPGADLARIALGAGAIWMASALGTFAIVQGVRWVARGFDR